MSATRFFEICRLNGLVLSRVQQKLLMDYVDLLITWNRKINLISRRDESEVWSRHILGSVAFLFDLRFPEKAKIADIGTGGGLPGIPLAILFEDYQIVLIESIRKKAGAVSDMLARLHLKNASVVGGRAEDMSMQEEFKQSFGFVISRAVASAGELIKWTRPLLRSDGHPEVLLNPDKRKVSMIPCPSIVMLKGGDLTKEIEEARRRYKPREIAVHPIKIGGLNSNEEHIDKKVVVVQP